jgi:hypothetical protein
MSEFQPYSTAEQWSAQTNTTDSILDMERYNGRINILDDSDPNLRFQMTEKIAIKNKATEYRDPLVGITEDNVLAQVYFSEGNVQILQNGLRAGVYEKSQQKIVVPPQSIENLKIIMRSIFLQYAEYSDEPIPQQIERLNSYVLDYAVNSVYNEAIGYLNYCRDQSTLVVPLERPQQSREFSTLEFKQWF